MPRIRNCFGVQVSVCLSPYSDIYLDKHVDDRKVASPPVSLEHFTPAPDPLRHLGVISYKRRAMRLGQIYNELKRKAHFDFIGRKH